jgi:hypothetical protein
MLDLRHVIPREIVHEFAGDVRDVNGADLIDQDFGLPPRDDGFRLVSQPSLLSALTSSLPDIWTGIRPHRRW